MKESEPHVCWTVSSTSYLRNLDADDLQAEAMAIHYQRPPVRNDNGSTSYSLNFPLLLVTGYLANQREVAEKVAGILEKHWEDPTP